ncbi:AraC family transcriptional regulator [Paenibacillus massiliensis]|uniref:AraC family transcriptional regulator n=1 Tax=Paenibacillus massiliensis TaxID=225917 RepID=UPI00046F0751|nr:AraC family transcriptional regulator [Paenibacillus massiliensis]
MVLNVHYENRSYTGDIPLRIYKHTQFSFHAHWHTDIEFVWVREGTLRMGINGDMRTLEEGDMAICCSGDTHVYVSTGPATTIYILVFRPTLIGNHGNWPEKLRFQNSFITRKSLEQQAISPAIMDDIVRLIEHIYEEMRAQKPHYQMFVTSKVMELCGIAQRYLPSTSIDANQENKRIARLKTIHDILQYIENNYNRPLTLETTASHFNLSSFHFSRLLQGITGTNFRYHLNAVRIEIAEEMIKSSEETITRIALECGFNNVRTFNRAFRQIKGYTPSELRCV